VIPPRAKRKNRAVSYYAWLIGTHINRIHRLELQNGGDYEVALKSQTRLRLSRRFGKRLQESMGAMLGWS